MRIHEFESSMIHLINKDATTLAKAMQYAIIVAFLQGMHVSNNSNRF